MKARGLMETGLGLVVLIALIMPVSCKAQKSEKAEQAVKTAVDPMETCSLLKKEEVETVMKQKIQDLEPQNGYCQYWSREPKDISFSIMVSPFDPSGGNLKDMKRTMEKDAEKHGQVIKQAEGFGADAFFQLVPAENTTFLHLIKGKYYFIFEIRADKENALPEDGVKVLVGKVLERV